MRGTLNEIKPYLFTAPVVILLFPTPLVWLGWNLIGDPVTYIQAYFMSIFIVIANLLWLLPVFILPKD